MPRLDIQAQHVVRTVRNGDEIPVIANITGTLYSAEGLAREHLPAADLGNRSRLVPDHRAIPPARPPRWDRASALQTGLSYFSSALSSELERALIQDFGVPIDLIEIRPGVSSSAGTAGTLTQLAAGWQIGKKTFLTFSAGFCPDFGQLRGRNAGGEPRVPLQPRVEAASSGGAHRAELRQRERQRDQFTSTNPYQIGLDILWEREF